SSVLSRPFAVFAAFPAALMLIQMLPLPFLANPVWASASAGFPHGTAGSISVDIGATALALARYLSAVGAGPLAPAVAINRERAESLLVGTTAASALISLAVLIHDAYGSGLLALREEALDCACLGVTLSAACAVLVFERYETRRYKAVQPPKKVMI